MTPPSRLDPEKQREYNRRYRERHPERIKAKQKDRDEYRRKWMIDHPEAAWAYRLKKFHRLTIQRYEEIWQHQGGRCYLCEEPLVRGKTHIDHDHACCPEGRSCHLCRRGLACRRCNWIIGWSDEDPSRLRRIADNFERAACFTLPADELRQESLPR